MRELKFDEIVEGYTRDEALANAKRCLNCKHKPCVRGCPLGVDIPKVLKLLVEGKVSEAYCELIEKNPMPLVCSRVCDQRRQCEGRCVRGIKGDPVAIGMLERFVADTSYADGIEQAKCNVERKGKKVAVVGGGPSGLACARRMYMYGYDVTVFEAMPVAGGVLMYGIPEFRLPKSIVSHEIQKLVELGIKIETNVTIGKGISVDKLLKNGYSAVYLGIGAGTPKFMGIEGENAKGVYTARDFLTSVKLKDVEEMLGIEDLVHVQGTVAVIGGGNVAMDVARTARRVVGNDVYVIYRRCIKDMPARASEVESAMNEGVKFKFLRNPKRIITDDQRKVTAIECDKMIQGDIDDSGRRKVVPTGECEKILVDTVVMSVGQAPNELRGVKTRQNGGIMIDKNTHMTSKEGVFAGGDVVTGPATVAAAIKAGLDAAYEMNKYIIGEYL